MRILHIAENATIRVFKEVLTHQSRWPTALWYKGTFHTRLAGCVGVQSTWVDYEQLSAKLSAGTADGYDVVQVHTSLANGNLVKQVAKAVEGQGKSVIWDMHDWYAPTEILPFADHVIVPSSGYAESLKRLYDVDASVFYSMLPRELFPKDLPTRTVDAGVLVSGIQAPGGDVYRDYTEVQRGLRDELFIHADAPKTLHAYYDNLFMVAPYQVFMRQLPKYKFGYAGAANSRHSIHDCVTNKFWEYVAAGLPVLTYRSDDMSNIGWFGQELAEIGEELGGPEWGTLEQRWANRFRYTMESQTSKFARMYQELVRRKLT